MKFPSFTPPPAPPNKCFCISDECMSCTCPRVSPSVASIAMVRTVFSPRCCATSSTSRDDPSATDTYNANAAANGE